MTDTELEALLEAAWKRRLTKAERDSLQAWGRQNPARWRELEAEFRLAEEVQGMEDVPVPSNFMAQVWQGVDRAEEEAHRSRASAPPGVPLWRRWLPRFALAAVLAGVSVAGWWHHQADHRTELAREISFLSAEVPDPRMLGEFEAIRAMSESAGPLDVELLTALQ
jgi:hypothetical protein